MTPREDAAGGGCPYTPSRRGLFAGLGALGAGTFLSGASACATAAEGDTEPRHDGGIVPFHGRHQAGVGTPQQDRLVFAAYDLTPKGSVKENRDALVSLLRTWTAAAEAMCHGKPVPGASDSLEAPPTDTGEARGLPPSDLTVTVGFGPSLFDDRFGLAGMRPAALADIPRLPPEDLDPARCGGDLAIQACASDPQVAFHAVRNLARLGREQVVVRWVQLGFGRAASTSRKQKTPRNLFGFKDGTDNIHAEESDAMSRYVWVGDETDQPWMKHGTYLVARRIAMRIEAWDRDFLEDQQRVFGRVKTTGAPLTGTKEFAPVQLKEKGPDGQPRIPIDAHIRLAAPSNNGGERILRRAFNYTDGMLANGELDAGLFMIIFQRDPRKQFVRIQRSLGTKDALSEYIEHVGSAVFACPPGVREGRYWGQSLLEA